MDPLYLNVEERVRINANAGAFPDGVCQPLLVHLLDHHKTLLRNAVMRKWFGWFKPSYCVEVVSPLVADALAYPVRKPRIRVHQPAPGSNAVRFVAEFAGIEIVKAGHQVRLHQSGVQLRYAVDRMAPTIARLAMRTIGVGPASIRWDQT